VSMPSPKNAVCGFDASGAVVAVANHERVLVYYYDGHALPILTPAEHVPDDAPIQNVEVTAGPGFFLVTVGWRVSADLQGTASFAFDLAGNLLWQLDSDSQNDGVLFIGDDGTAVMRRQKKDWQASHSVLVAKDGTVTELAPGFHPLGPPTRDGRIAGQIPELAGWLDLSTGEHTLFEAHGEKASVFMWGDALMVLSAAPKELRRVPASMVSDTSSLEYPGWLWLQAQAGAWLLMRGGDTGSWVRFHADGLTQEVVDPVLPQGQRLLDDCYAAQAIDGEGRLLAVLRDDDSAALWRYEVHAPTWTRLGQPSIGARMADVRVVGSTVITHYRDLHTYCQPLEWGADAAPMVSDALEITAPHLEPSLVLGGFSDVVARPDGRCVAYHDRTAPNGAAKGKPVIFDTLTRQTLELEGWGSIAFARGR